MNVRIKGAGTALVTPFTAEGAVDETALRKIIRHNIDGGIDFLCVLGTTAETPTLSRGEQLLVRKIVLDESAGMVPLILGFGGNNTALMTETLGSEDFSGFDALLVVTPFYNKPNQEGLYCHYKALAAASPRPLFIYNVPGRTGVNILPETVARLASECPSIVGIKEASGKIDQIRKLISLCPKEFVVLSGDDALTCDIMAAGGWGVISVISNMFPGQVAKVVHSSGKEAVQADAAMTKYFEPLFREGNPVGIKALLSVNGLCGNYLRLPLVPASAGLVEEFKNDCNG